MSISNNSPPTQKPAKILLVDDEPLDLKLFRTFLEDAGYAVLQASSGLAALPIARTEHPDLIITDLLMRGMEGFELVRLLRAEPRLTTTPVIVCSGTFADPRSLALVERYGVDCFLVKPSSSSDLLGAVANALSRAAAWSTASVPRRMEIEHKQILADKLADKVDQLAASEDRFRQLAEKINAVFWLSDPAGKEIYYVSPAYERIWGRSCESLYASARSWIDAIHPDDRAGILESEARQTETGGHDHTYRIVRPDGEVRWVRDQAFPVRDQSGQLKRMAGIAEDITEQRVLQEELAIREQRLDSFFTSATAGLAILDPQLRFVRINQTLAEINGLPIREHLGKTVREVLPAMAPLLEPLFQNVIATRQPILNREISGETPAQPGKLRWWMASYFPIQSMAIELGGGRASLSRRTTQPLSNGGSKAKPMKSGDPKVVGLGAVIVEITEQKLAEKQLHELLAQSRSLSERLVHVREEEAKRIARELHDELGQSLTALNLDITWLESRLAKVKDPDLRAQLADRLQRMTQSLQSNSEAVKKICAELRPSLLDHLGLAPALEWYADEFAARTGLRCAWTIKPHPVALPDPIATTVFRVFQEILTNIARHAAAQHVSMSLQETAGRVELIVTDDGQGFGRNNGTKPGSFGLVGMNERAQAAGGSLEIQSAPGQGTTIRLRVPVGGGAKP